jgi:hypothetical protein
MVIVWLSLLHYFNWISGFVAYFFVVVKKIKISNVDFIVLLGLAVPLLVQFVFKDLTTLFIESRFFWGWLIFYFIFKSRVIDENKIRTVLVVLCIMVLAEAVLINVFISPLSLPNWTGHKNFINSGMYMGPHSFGGGRTVCSSLLVVLMAMINVRGWRFWLSCFTVLAVMSGTGTLALLLLLLVRYKGTIIKAAPLLTLALFLFDFLFPELFKKAHFIVTDRITIEYLMWLIDFKLMRIDMEFENIKDYMIIFGNPESTYRGGDFAFLSFVVVNGFWGVALVLRLIISRVNKKNRLPILLIMGTSIHYGVMFSLPGQMLFGLLLSIGKDGLSSKVMEDSGKVIR